MRTFICFALLFAACSTVNEALVEKEVIAEFRASEQAWNEGSIDGFMRSYLRSGTLRFAGHDRYTLGWEKVLANYKKGYPDREAMGKLTFSDVHVTVLSADAALVFGRWQVEKKEETSEGLYTLLFRKTGDGWRIVHDHTTTAGD
jgi:ketosteroid isomerase-like protein